MLGKHLTVLAHWIPLPTLGGQYPYDPHFPRAGTSVQEGHAARKWQSQEI